MRSYLLYRPDLLLKLELTDRIISYMNRRMCMGIPKGSPTVAKSRTLLLKSYLKSMKSLDFQNLKSRKLVWKLVKSCKFTFPVMLKS